MSDIKQQFNQEAIVSQSLLKGAAKDDGFSLIEVMVVLLLLSVITLITTDVLGRYLDGHKAINSTMIDMQNVIKARAIIREDLLQRVVTQQRQDLDVISNVGDSGYVFSVIRYQPDPSIEVKSTTGLQKVVYFHQNGHLVRRVYDSAFPANDTEYREQILLSNVQELDVQYALSGQWFHQRDLDDVLRLANAPTALSLTWVLGEKDARNGVAFDNHFLINGAGS